jgi:hypothetical protein
VERAAAASSQVLAILPGEGQPSTGQGRGGRHQLPLASKLASQRRSRLRTARTPHDYMEPGRHFHPLKVSVQVQEPGITVDVKPP